MEELLCLWTHLRRCRSESLWVHDWIRQGSNTPGTFWINSRPYLYCAERGQNFSNFLQKLKRGSSYFPQWDFWRKKSRKPFSSKKIDRFLEGTKLLKKHWFSNRKKIIFEKKMFFSTNFFSSKIENMHLRVKHIESRASNSSWAARTSQPKSKNPRRSFFSVDNMLRSSVLRCKRSMHQNPSQNSKILQNHWNFSFRDRWRP